MPTSDITRLLAAYREAAAAIAAWDRPRPFNKEFVVLQDALDDAWDKLHAALTDDTIEALVKVAKAAGILADEFHELVEEDDYHENDAYIGTGDVRAALATLDAIRPTPDQEGEGA